MSVRIPDTNGWFEIPANPLTRAGVFDYLGSTIKAPDPSKVYKVLRPAEELSSQETLNSFRLLPFVDDHTMLGVATTDDKYVDPVTKGVHGVTGDQIYFDPSNETVYGNLKIWSAAQDEKIKAGKRDVSMGYKCKYDWTPGVYKGQPYDCVQRSIRGNHNANVFAGRMGSDVAVMDGDELVTTFVATFDGKDIIMAVKPTVLKAAAKKIVAAYGKHYEKKLKPGTVIATMDAADVSELSSDASFSDIADLLADVLPQIGDINDAMPNDPSDDDDMEAAMDAAGNPVLDSEGKPKMQKKQAAAKAVGTMDAAEFVVAMDAAVAKAIAPLQVKIVQLETVGGPKNMVAEIAKRDTLANQLSSFVGTFDHREMTLQEVAVYGVGKLELPTVAGQEVSSVMAYLHNRPIPKPTHTVGTMDAKGNPRKSSVATFVADAGTEKV